MTTIHIHWQDNDGNWQHEDYQYPAQLSRASTRLAELKLSGRKKSYLVIMPKKEAS